MTEVVTNMALGAAAGGGLQFLSEGLKVFQMLADNALKQTEMANGVYRRNIEAENKTADAAAKRSRPWLRATIAIIVFTVAFIGLWANGIIGIDTSIVTEKEPWFNLFNLIKFGKALEVTTASGFVIPPYFGAAVQVITGFLFGVMAVRTGKTVI